LGSGGFLAPDGISQAHALEWHLLLGRAACLLPLDANIDLFFTLITDSN